MLGIVCNLLLVTTSIIFISISIDRDLAIRSDLSCKLLPLVIRALAQVSIWIQVMITYDRLVFVAHANKCHRLRNFLKERTNLAKAIALLAGIIFLVNIEHFWFYLVDVDSSRICTSSKYLLFTRDLITGSLRFLLPFVLILIGNTMLMRVFIESKLKTKNKNTTREASSNDSLPNRGAAAEHPLLPLPSPNAASQSSTSSFNNLVRSQQQSINLSMSRKEKSFLRSIISMDLFFMLTLTPLVIFGALLYIYNHSPALNSPTSTATLTLIFFYFIYMSSFDIIFPFIINLAFNKLFKSELKKLIKEIALRLANSCNWISLSLFIFSNNNNINNKNTKFEKQTSNKESRSWNIYFKL